MHQRELPLVFVVGALAADADVALAVHADGEHIDVIEAEIAAVAEVGQLRFDDIGEGHEVIHDIAGGTVHVRADGAHPVPGILTTPVAGGEQDLPAGGLERHGHGLVAHFAVAVGREIAEVVLQEIHAPVRKGLRIHKLVVKTGGIARAGAHARTGVHAEFQPLAVNIVRNGLHAVREFFGIGHEQPVFVALLQRPAVVNDEVFISGVAVALFHHDVRHLANEFFIDIGSEGIPGIPAHRRGSCNHIQTILP